MSEEFPDHYGILNVDPAASSDGVRKAFRARLLEVHPDKAVGEVEPALLDAIMRASEVLGDPGRREEYDRRRSIRARMLDPLESIPHVTESQRPIDRARAILFFLLEEKPEEATVRLEALEEEPLVYLTRHLEVEEMIDASFLMGELYESRASHFEALAWYQEVIRLERKRRRHRPCYEETLDRTKRLLIQKIVPRVDARTSLEYLRRAETLDLDRVELADVHKRRAMAYLELDMKAESARQLQLALTAHPQLKGVRRLREELDGYL